MKFDMKQWFGGTRSEEPGELGADMSPAPDLLTTFSEQVQKRAVSARKSSPYGSSPFVTATDRPIRDA